jgi:lysophospholipid acyltransferase 1/2
VSTSSKRAQYYMAWIIAELVNNASGFGFNGYDMNGNAKWDLLTNVNIIKLEVIKTCFFFFLSV